MKSVTLLQEMKEMEYEPHLVKEPTGKFNAASRMTAAIDNPMMKSMSSKSEANYFAEEDDEWTFIEE